MTEQLRLKGVVGFFQLLRGGSGIKEDFQRLHGINSRPPSGENAAELNHQLQARLGALYGIAHFLFYRAPKNQAVK